MFQTSPCCIWWLSTRPAVRVARTIESPRVPSTISSTSAKSGGAVLDPRAERAEHVARWRPTRADLAGRPAAGRRGPASTRPASPVDAAGARPRPASAARVDGDRRAARGRRVRPGPRASAPRRRRCAPSGPATPSGVPGELVRPDGHAARAWCGSRRRRRTPPACAASRRGPSPGRAGPCPVASATAAPPLEPPQVSAGFQGLRRGAEDRVERVAARAELRRVGLADDDGARRLEPLDREGVVVGHVVLEDLRAPRGADALGRRQVLDRHRHAVERAGASRACRAPRSPCGPPPAPTRAPPCSRRSARGFTRSIRASTACITSSGETLRRPDRARPARWRA